MTSEIGDGAGVVEAAKESIWGHSMASGHRVSGEMEAVEVGTGGGVEGNFRTGN